MAVLAGLRNIRSLHSHFAYTPASALIDVHPRIHQISTRKEPTTCTCCVRSFSLSWYS